MARPSTKTPKKLEALRAARASGKSLRASAEAAGVPFETARRWEKRGARRTIAGDSNDPATLPKKKAARKIAPPSPAEIDAVLGAPPPDGQAELRERLTLIRGLLDRLAPAVEKEEYPATSFVTLARYGDELARLLVELTPPVPPDPSLDPANVEAKRLLLSTIEGLVSKAEVEP